MRNILFFPVILALFAFDADAFGATTRRGTAVPAVPATTSAKPAAARVATGRIPTNKNTPKATTAEKLGSKPVSSGGRVTTARVGATNKVINMGTKVETARENTVVSQECQDAYYGCMDAFCMLDNTSGGRCQCSDRSAELDKALEEILKLDEQSYALATEGVERIQMGENADAIMARAKAAADNVTTQTISGISSDSKSSSRRKTLVDLSAWNSTIFDEDSGLDADIFNDVFQTAASELDGKTGDNLHSAAAKICTQNLSAQCSSSASFLQLTYAQKIKSDCAAYENSLKQQRNSSQQKLQTAQKALRDAALEMYENENKYDLGQCVVEFKKCMQTTAECGTDFSGCIADTSILQALYGKTTKKIATTNIKTGATTITISSATYDILNNKKSMCESVTKQCVNANKKDAVWQTVIKDIAPAVYSAEYVAASDSRKNCMNIAATCVREVCSSGGIEEGSDNYDACVSDPDIPAASCKLELARCSGNTDDIPLQEKVWGYVKAKLAAMKVDRCTQQVKDCLTSEDNCGADYTNCLGLDTDTIVDFCPEDKLVACQTKFSTESNPVPGKESVRSYISRVAQGLALNIDNSFANACKNAADAAFARVCGADLENEDDDTSADLCPNLVLTHNEAKGEMKWEYCKKKDDGTSECYIDLSYFETDDFVDNLIYPEITGYLTELSTLSFDRTGKCGGAKDFETYFCVDDSNNNTGVAQTLSVPRDDGGTGESAAMNDALNVLLQTMNRDYSLIIGKIQEDSTVKNCREGRTFTGISTRTQTDKTTEARVIGREEGRFVNLLDSAESEISGKIMNAVLSDYYDELNALKSSGKREEMYEAISKRRSKIIADRLSRQLMQGKSLCKLSEEEFATLMANEEVQNTLKTEQDNVNQANCEEKEKDKAYITCGAYHTSGYETTATPYREEPNFCSKPAAIRTNVAVCPYGNAGSQTYRRTPSYDAATNTCNVKVETFKCKQFGINRRNRAGCVRWDSGNPDKTETVKYQMPEWSDKDSVYYKDGCTGGSASGATTR